MRDTYSLGGGACWGWVRQVVRVRKRVSIDLLCAIDRYYGASLAGSVSGRDPHAQGGRRGAFAVLGLFLLAGCAVGPDFAVPPSPDDAGYSSEPMPASTASAPVAEGGSQRFVPGKDIPADWWALFHNRHVTDLVQRALTANPSLQASQAALRQARETVYATEGMLLPQIDGTGSVTRQQFSLANFGQSGPPILFNLFQASVNVAYSPDVFGGKRRQLESAQAQANYQRFQLEASYLTMTSNVVTAAIQEASLVGQIEATRDIIKAESEQLVVVRNQFNAGSAPRTDVLSQESQLVQTQATLPGLQKLLAQQRHLLMVLTGRFPNQGRGETLRLAALRLPARLPVSLPSQLVEQRPDVRAAQEQLHQASAQVGVAIANMLPQINLTADYGTTALTAAQMFTPNAAVWSIAGGVTQPIFHGGTLLHQERAAVAAYEQADAQYRNTVLLAFQNVADVLRALQDDARTLEIQERAVRVAAENNDLTRIQYRDGTITYLTLLNAQRAYEQARLNLVLAQAARLADTAALFQALGGGWWNRTDAILDDHPKPGYIDVITGSLH
jgi:NodT family efflux transporter outer membrane factor (OMF) lipoprotein